jgi:hypothetical protein
VTTHNQVLEIAMVDHLPALVRATKPIEHLDIETTGFEAEQQTVRRARVRRQSAWP